MIKGIIFDFDGTLVYNSENFNEKRVIKTLKKMGYECDLEKAREAWHYIPELKRSLGFTDEQLEEFRKIFKEDDVNREENTFAFEGVRVLEELDVKKAILTSCPKKIFVQEFRALKKSFPSLKFNPIIITKPVHGLEDKPSPQGLNYILKYWGLNKDEVIMVGDSNRDYLTAVNAGVKFYYVNPFSTPEKNAETLKSLEELKQVLAQKTI